MHFNWWTLALQTVNVLVLIWILARFFFRPVADVVAKRQAEAEKLLSDAAAARQEAADTRTEVAKVRAGIGAERDRLISEAQKAARVEKETLLTEASQEISKRHGEAEAAIARDQAAADHATIERAGELAVDIARRLLARIPADASATAFLDGLCAELRALPATEKASFASALADHPIEVATATPVSNEEEASIRSALQAALGANVPLSFKSDAGLIAGIELNGRNTILRNSWRADLERIREELGHGQHHRES